MVETVLMALHSRHAVAQAFGAAQLTMQERHEMALGRQCAHTTVGVVLVNTALESAPWDELQNLVKQGIVMPHGVGSISVFERAGKLSNHRRINAMLFVHQNRTGQP